MRCHHVSKLYEEVKILFDGLLKSFEDLDTKKVLDYKKRFFQPFLETREALMGIIDDPHLLLLRGFLARKFGYAFVGEFHEGFAVAKIADQKYLVIDKFGNKLTDNVFCDADNFSNGVARVKLENYKWGFIKKDGSLIIGLINSSCYSEFKKVDNFHNGFAMVELPDLRSPFGGLLTSGGWDFIKKDFSLLSDERYVECKNFCNGFARVKRSVTSGCWNFIDENGEELNNIDYKSVSDFQNNCALVYTTYGSINFIDGNGNEKYLWMGDFIFGYAMVQRKDGSWNFVSGEGVELNDEQYDLAKAFDNSGYAKVRRFDGAWGFVDRFGRFADERQYHFCGPLINGFAHVSTRSGFSNFIKKDGSLLCQKNLPYTCYNFYRGLARIHRKEDGAWNFLKDDGTLLLGDDWLIADHVSDFEKSECAFVRIGDSWKVLDRNGNFSSEIYESFKEIESVSNKRFFVLGLADGSGKVIFDQSGKKISSDKYSFVGVFERLNRPFNSPDIIFDNELKKLLIVSKVGEDSKYFIDHNGRKIFDAF